MTRDEFILKYRGQLLVFLTEAWAVRSLQPSQLGLVMDRHAIELKRLISEMYDDLTPDPLTAPKTAANGHTVRVK